MYISLYLFYVSTQTSDKLFLSNNMQNNENLHYYNKKQPYIIKLDYIFLYIFFIYTLSANCIKFIFFIIIYIIK